MLLPMLSIYQEYVRNHHFSLQVLAECKQRDKFANILQRLEEKTVLQGRTLETFLTYPMHQVGNVAIISMHFAYKPLQYCVAVHYEGQRQRSIFVMCSYSDMRVVKAGWYGRTTRDLLFA